MKAAYNKFKTKLERIIPVFIDINHIPFLLKTLNGYHFNIFELNKSITDLCDFIIDQSNIEPSHDSHIDIGMMNKNIQVALNLIMKIPRILYIALVDRTGITVIYVYKPKKQDVKKDEFDGFNIILCAIMNAVKEIEHTTDYLFVNSEDKGILAFKGDVLDLYIYNEDIKNDSKFLQNHLNTIILLKNFLFENIPEDILKMLSNRTRD